MRFSPLNFLRHMHHSHRGHQGHHGHHGHHHGHGHRDLDGGDRFERLMTGVSARLDLNALQQELLNEVLTQVQRQRRTWATAAAGPELPALLATDSFDRAAAQQLLDAKLAALSSAGTGLIAAAADLFDSLDFEQQQALRFMLRVRRGRVC